MDNAWGNRSIFEDPSRSTFIHEEPAANVFNRHKYLSIGNNRWSAVRREGERGKDLAALSRKLKGVPRRGRPAARQSSSLISRHSRFFHFYRRKHRAKRLAFEITYLRGIESRPFPGIYWNLIPRFERVPATVVNHSGGGRSAVAV